METATIGSQEEASFLASNVTRSPGAPWLRLVDEVALKKAGWQRVGNPSAYRSVFLAPSGFVYKVQVKASYGGDGTMDMNSIEVKNWATLTDAGLAPHVPDHQLFTAANKDEDEAVEITAVEFLPKDPGEERMAYYSDEPLYTRISQFIGDIHGENFYWSESKGVFMVIDAGNTARSF